MPLHLRVGDKFIGPGTIARVRIGPPDDSVEIVVFSGLSSGTRLFLCAGLHGDELKRFLGRDDKQSLADLRHDPIQQNVIETQRVVQRIPKSRRDRGIEQKRAVAVLEAEINQCDSTPLAI